MKKIVMLDKNDNVTKDPAQAVRAIETEYEQGHLVKETFYFVKEERTMTKQKSDLTWLQCQLPRAEWDALNARRLALKLTWAEVIAPGTKDYIAKLEATPADASAEHPAVTTTTKGPMKKTHARKSKGEKRTPSIAEVI